MEYTVGIVLRTLEFLFKLFEGWYQRKGKVKQLEFEKAMCKKQLASTRGLLAVMVALFLVIIWCMRSARRNKL